MKVGIIGGGPAGMFAAIEAAKKGYRVSIIDNNSVLGRKLSVTGGGRGNLTNLDIHSDHYFFQDLQQKNVLGEILKIYDANFLIQYLYDLGIPTYHTDDGWVYPISNSAKNLSRYLSELLTQHEVTHISKTFIDDLRINPKQVSLVDSADSEYHFDHVLIATGGNAYPQVGASSKILNTLSKNGYQTRPVHPALAPLKTSKKQTGLLKGIRFNAQLSLSSGKSVFAKEDGNIIFTEWGLNGPGVMNLSHFYHTSQNPLKLTINPIIIYKKEIEELIRNHLSPNLTLAVLFLSFIPEGLIFQYQKNQNNLINETIKHIRKFSIDDLIRAFNLEEVVLGTRDFKFSQLSTGGIKLNQVDLSTMKSNIHSNLSFAGEILDIVGPCGGFNLHWAFISGLIAGKHL